MANMDNINLRFTIELVCKENGSRDIRIRFDDGPEEIEMLTVVRTLLMSAKVILEKNFMGTPETLKEFLKKQLDNILVTKD